MRLRFPHSHAFRGGRLTIEEEGDPGPGCLVMFGDGTTVIATCRPDGDAVHLSVPAYRTAKGTPVKPRDWRLVRRADGIWRSEPAA